MIINHILTGKPVNRDWNGKTHYTSTYKYPVTGTVNVNESGVDGDEQGDLVHHGGKYKAVYAYAEEHYEFWRNKLPASVDLSMGAFGENIVIAGGFTEDEVCLGDTFQSGSLIMRAAEARMPCQGLALRLEYNPIIKEFTDAGRFGVYLSVDQNGIIEKGAALSLLEKDDARISIRQVGEMMSGKIKDRSQLENCLQHPHLSPYLHKKLSARLEALSA